MLQWLNNLIFFWRRPPPPPAVLFPELPWEPPPPVPEPAQPICEECNRPYDPRIRARMKLRKLAKARREASDIVNDILSSLKSLDLHGGHKWGATDEAKALNELLGCDFYMFDANFNHDALAPGDKWSIFAAHEREDVEDLSEICWPIDTATAIHYEADEIEGECYQLMRVRSVTPEEARGHAHTFVPKMVRHTFLKMYMDGTWYTEDNFAGLIQGRWRFIDRKMSHTEYRGGYILVRHLTNTPKNRKEIHESVTVNLSMALTRRYSWHVALGNTRDGPRVLLPTNPTGCLHFFKNRDKASGKKRRDALRHWVSRHYRERSDAGTYYVRDHLRGQTEFRWADLECEIFVSEFDLEKNEAFKLEAELWRSQRKHNSVRVRLKRKSA